MLTATETAMGRAQQEIRNQPEPGGTEDSRKQSSATSIRIVNLLIFLGFVATSIASDIFDVLLIVRTLHSP